MSPGKGTKLQMYYIDPFYHGSDSNLLSLEKTHYPGMALPLVVLPALLTVME